MPDIAQHLRLSQAELDVHEVLTSPVTILLGVDEAAAAALDALGLKTVFDLGTSALFAQVDTAIEGDWAAIGSFPPDLLKQSAVPASLEDLPSRPLDSLRGISSNVAVTLTTALGVDTLRDLANWPPRLKAREFVAMALGTDLKAEADGFAEKLRPAMGEYPTERVYYDKLVMFGGTGDQSLQPLQGTISLASPDSNQNALKTPTVGALVTLSQSWFSQGVTLGHMLHSLALAPGEATRVAVVDWERRTRAATSETIAETERLDSAASHSRAISEVQNAVASEMQRGESMSDGWSESTSDASNFSASLGGGVAGFIGEAASVFGFSIGGSTSDQYARTDTYAHSASWSVGSRAASAYMAQNVNDRTEQHASSVRSRRASAVREVSQSEHEQISTRVVANYNHMHALTVQYYEVVQVYRVVVRTHAVERVLFLPFEILDFSAANAMELVDRYRGQLVPAALTRRVRSLLIDSVGQIEIRSGVRIETPINIFTVAAGGVVNARVTTAALENATGLSGSGETPPAPPAPRTATVIRRGPLEQSLPGNAKLVRISFEDLGIAKVRLEYSGQADPEEFDVPSTNNLPLTDVRLATVSAIQVASSDGTEDSGKMTLHCEIDGRVATVPLTVALGSGTRMQTAAFIDADPSDREGELFAHLQANRAYYTRVVLRGLDSASLVMLLAPFSWNGKPLADQIEPRAVAVAGNYLVLRAPAKDDDASGIAGQTWKAALEERKINFTESDTRLVPIPTGGVFAEAVLGRSNSAEKLDITRFWNWQDSPIPLQPTEIAPVSAGSRAQAENLLPGQLGAPVLNIMNPTALPDPSGLSAIIGAIANGNMFRDMSGLAGTQEMARAMSAGTLSAATEAGRINSENFRIATQQATEMAKTAADMWKAYQQSNGKEGENTNKSVSAEGARVNHGRDMDERGIKRPGGSAGSSDEEGEFSAVAEEGGGDGEFSDGGTERMEPISNEMLRGDSGAGIPSTTLREALEAHLPGMNVLTAGGKKPAAAISQLEKTRLNQLKVDSSKAGLNLAQINIISMKKHPFRSDFRSIGFLAWTHNSTDVYFDFVDSTGLTNYINNLVSRAARAAPNPSNISRKKTFNKVLRALYVSGIKHELFHTKQFISQGGPPPKFKDMVLFEITAYQESHDWWVDPNTRTFLKADIGLPDWMLDGPTGLIQAMAKNALDSKKIFDDISSGNMADDDNVREDIIYEGYLPPKIGKVSGYSCPDLYAVII